MQRSITGLLPNKLVYITPGQIRKSGVTVQNCASFTEKTKYTYLLFFTKQCCTKENAKGCVAVGMLLKVPMTQEDRSMSLKDYQLLNNNS